MKALIVGLGGIGQRHARNLRELLGRDVDLLAYRERGLSHVVTPQLGIDKTRIVEEEHGIRSFSDLDAALCERPDVALICNPTSRHVEIATRCAEAGCDLFLEKPVSDSMTGVPELLRAVRATDRIAMVGYQLRFHPVLRAAARALEDGACGPPVSVRATVGEYLPNFHRYEDYRRMYAARADLGGGVIVTQIHEFDWLYSLFGLPSRVYALGGHWSRLEIDVEDTASVLMECSAAGRPLPVHLHQDYLQDPPSRNGEIICEHGKISLDFAQTSLSVQVRGGMASQTQFPSFQRNDLFLDQTRHFLDCVARRVRPIVDLRDGVQSLRMALAAKASIASQCAVSLEEIPFDE